MNELRVDPPAAAGLASRRPDPLAFVRGQLREPYVQLLASQVLTGAVAMAANILMVRSMTPTHRGEVALLLQVVYLATQVLLLGTERSFVASYHNVAPGPAVRAYGRLLLLPVAVGLAGAVLYTVVAPHRHNPGPVIVAMLAWYTVIEAAALASRAVAIAVGRVRDFMVCRVIESVLLLAMLIGLFIAHQHHPELWFLAYLFAGAVPTVLYLAIWLRLPVNPDAVPVRRELNTQVRREGLALFPAAISNMAMLRVDRLVIPALASTAALGLYTSVATMTELLAWPLRAYADSRLGRWRASHHDGGLQAGPIVLAAAVYSLVVVPIVAGALYLLIVPVFGHQYAPARVVVLPLVVAAGLYAVSRVTLGLLIAKGHGGLVSVAEITGFVVSFAVYLLLIPRMGILGAAYGSLAGYGACLLFALIASRVAKEKTDA
ncbi:Membrane protein involved in the export of O-antigen and teichoic acid [Actinoplanes regularis]|uniref:Membrane protein involved in the export of O-antigen and teichoic acid n=1 Tax=Actinoplanes regularis TaxID=52697 RepID=A0A239JBF2_9ACTN|nr:Membrane protein involved in the export of O-antigen and teichoic acid [Actinoplanes regularis]